MSLKILGTGSYLPPNVVTNADLAKTLDTSDEWIFAHSGIHSRHLVGPDESTATSAVRAGRSALSAAGVDASEIDMLAVATCSPDYLLPSTASIVQKELGWGDEFLVGPGLGATFDQVSAYKSPRAEHLGKVLGHMHASFYFTEKINRIANLS